MLDVYIGFMDEEVSSVLIPLLDKAEKDNRPLFIFERGTVDNTLFERHLKSYKKEFRKIIVAGSEIKGNPDEGGPIDEDYEPGVEIEEDYEHIVGSSLSNIMQLLFGNGILEKYWERLHDNAKWKVTLNKPEGEPGEAPIFFYSVLAYNHINNGKRKNKEDAIVIIRSPEMGFQPNLLRTYLRAIFRTLHLFPGFDKGVKIKVFGGGGAIDKEDKPGTLHELNGTIFVGSDVRKDFSPGDKNYNPLVHFIGLTKENGVFIAKDIKFSCEERRLDKNDAQDNAKKCFKSLSNQKNYGDFITWKKDKKVSLTADFFIGQDIKQPGREIGLHDANMEDYHIFKIMKSIVEKPHLYGNSGEFSEAEYAEIASDQMEKLKWIFKISGELKRGELNAKLRESGTTTILCKETYADPQSTPSIIKGLYKVKNRSILQNLQLNRLLLSEYLKRNFNKKVPGEFELKHFSLVRVDCDPPVIHEDVKREFADWCKKAGYSKEKYISAIAWGLNGCDVTKLDKNPSNYKWEFADSGKFQDIFYKCRNDVLDPFYVEIATDFLAEIISKETFEGEEIKSMSDKEELIQKAKDLRKCYNEEQKCNPGALEYLFTKYFDNDTWIWKTDNIATEPSSFNNKAREKPSKHYKIWLRYKNWVLKGESNNEEKNKKIILDGVEFAESSLDRALYKSANQVALQKLAKEQIMPDI